MMTFDAKYAKSAMKTNVLVNDISLSIFLGNVSYFHGKQKLNVGTCHTVLRVSIISHLKQLRENRIISLLKGCASKSLIKHACNHGCRLLNYQVPRSYLHLSPLNFTHEHMYVPVSDHKAPKSGTEMWKSGA